jgi:hypothetical protein
LQEACAGLAERSTEGLLNQQYSDEIEKQRHEDFVHATPQMDRRRHSGPKRAKRGRAK